jgi:small subunit ribosomal protein S3
MGQKVHPYGFRLGIIRQPKTRWFGTGRDYTCWLIEDLKIRRFIRQMHRNAGISDITIDRTRDQVTVSITTAKPGGVIGRGGRDVETLRQQLAKLTDKRVRVNVEEAPEPDLNAQLVAENIARQIERRVSHRWAMRQAIERAMRLGAKGIRIKVAGRFGGADIARTESMGPVGRVPLQTLRADIDYGVDTAHTAYGPIGVRVWIYRGDVLPARRVRPEEEEVERLEAEITAAQIELHGDEAVPGSAVPEVTSAAVQEVQRPATIAPTPQPIITEMPQPSEPGPIEELMELGQPVAAEMDAEQGPSDEAAQEKASPADETALDSEEADKDVDA